MPAALYIPRHRGFQRIPLAGLLCLKRIPGGTLFCSRDRTDSCTLSPEDLLPLLPAGLFCQVNPDQFIQLSQVLCFDEQKVCLPGLQVPIHRSFLAPLLRQVRVISAADSTPLLELHVNTLGELCFRASG